MEDEIWKKIDYKNVKDNYYISNRGQVKNIKTNKIIKPYISSSSGYYYVSLRTKDDLTVKATIHRLVMIHFSDDKEKAFDERYVVNHIDCDKLNNNVENLEWVTYSGNAIHAVDHGMILSGEDAYGAKFSNELVHNICKMYEEGRNNDYIIKHLNLERTDDVVSLLVRIKTGKQWKQISDQYKFEKKAGLRHQSDETIHAICKLMETESSPSVIQMKLSWDNIIIDYTVLKKLVWFIRNKKSYVDISSQYNI